MEPYHSQTLKNALRLPALSWRLTFFGGHSQQVKAGWHIGTERHLAFELIQILAGTERVHLAQDAFVLTTGDILIIPPNLDHDITCLQDMSYFNFHFGLDDQELSTRLIERGLIYYPRSTQQNKELVPSLTELWRLIRPDMQYDFDTKLKVQKFFTDFLITLNRQTTIREQATSLTKLKYAGMIASGLQQQLKKQIFDFNHHGIDPRLTAALTVKKVISEAQISLSYGSEVFKDVYGVSPRAYLSELKLVEAKHLLLIPDYSILAISTALGYNEQSHFARQFKRWTGMTPNQYRNRNR